MFEKLIKSFGDKNITVIPAETGEDACRQILKIIPEKASVGCGWSETLESIGIFEKLKNGDYNFFDKTTVEYNSEEYYELMRLAQHADYYLSGSNAITEDGKIVNRDGTGNRTSSLLYGPKRVIIVVGANKIVSDLDSAIERINTVAAPKNAKRIGKSVNRISCSTTIIEGQKDPKRMTIIIVNKELGY